MKKIFERIPVSESGGIPTSRIRQLGRVDSCEIILHIVQCRCCVLIKHYAPVVARGNQGHAREIGCHHQLWRNMQVPITISPWPMHELNELYLQELRLITYNNDCCYSAARIFLSPFSFSICQYAMVNITCDIDWITILLIPNWYENLIILLSARCLSIS